jgi:HAD superfamily phosphatase (TIGR01668 family)
MFQRLLPEQVVRSVFDIDLEALRARGVRGIIADLDNTLVGARTPAVSPEMAEWLNRVRREGFRIVIVSNNRRARVSACAGPLGIPFISSARKPFSRSFRQALGLMELSAEEVAVVGDQLLTDVLGGRRLGLHTILVSPIAPREEGLTTQINRWIERWARSRLHRKGLWPNEGRWRDG